MQVTKRLEQTAAYFKRLGALSFWGQLVCTTVAAVILAFSIVVTGSVTAPATLYLTAAGIAAAFLSVFWSFGYMRLAQRLRATAHDPAKVQIASEACTCKVITSILISPVYRNLIETFRIVENMSMACVLKCNCGSECTVQGGSE